MSCTRDTGASVPEAVLCVLVRKHPRILATLTQADLVSAGVTWAEVDAWQTSHNDADAKSLQAA